MVSYIPLFTMLTKKKMTKTELRQNVGFTANTLAKMSKGEYISLRTIDKICLYLNCKIEDVIEIIPDEAKGL